MVFWEHVPLGLRIVYSTEKEAAYLLGANNSTLAHGNSDVLHGGSSTSQNASLRFMCFLRLARKFSFLLPVSSLFFLKDTSVIASGIGKIKEEKR